MSPDEFRLVLGTAGQRSEYEQSLGLRLIFRIVHDSVQAKLPLVQRAVAEKYAQVIVQEPADVSTRVSQANNLRLSHIYDLHQQRTVYPRRDSTCSSSTGRPGLRSDKSGVPSRTTAACFPRGNSLSSWTLPSPAVPARRSPISTFFSGRAVQTNGTGEKNDTALQLHTHTRYGDWKPVVFKGLNMGMFIIRTHHAARFFF